MRLSIISFAGIARTLVAVGTVNEASIEETTRAATPRSSSILAALGVLSTGAGFTAACAGVGVLTTGALATGAAAGAGTETTGAVTGAGVVTIGALATGAGAVTTGAVTGATGAGTETTGAEVCCADFGIGGVPPLGAPAIGAEEDVTPEEVATPGL